MGARKIPYSAKSERKCKSLLTGSPFNKDLGGFFSEGLHGGRDMVAILPCKIKLLGRAFSEEPCLVALRSLGTFIF